MTKPATLSFDADQLRKLGAMCESEMAAYANWIESAAIAGDADYTTDANGVPVSGMKHAQKLARERCALREVFAKFNSAHHVLTGKYL